MNYPNEVCFLLLPEPFSFEILLAHKVVDHQFNFILHTPLGTEPRGKTDEHAICTQLLVSRVVNKSVPN